jgi:hypothetical protein
MHQGVVETCSGSGFYWFILSLSATQFELRVGVRCDRKTLRNEECVRISKDALALRFVVSYANHPLEDRKGTKTVFKMAGSLVEIRTGLRRNASVRRYSHTSLPDMIVHYNTSGSWITNGLFLSLIILNARWRWYPVRLSLWSSRDVSSIRSAL